MHYEVHQEPPITSSKPIACTAVLAHTVGSSIVATSSPIYEHNSQTAAPQAATRLSTALKQCYKSVYSSLYGHRCAQ